MFDECHISSTAVETVSRQSLAAELDRLGQAVPAVLATDGRRPWKPAGVFTVPSEQHRAFAVAAGIEGIEDLGRRTGPPPPGLR